VSSKNLYEKFDFRAEGLSKDSFSGFDGKYHGIVPGATLE
jgi:hypothetical protein